VVQCDECAGEGAVYAHECETCGGTGRVQEARNLTVTIPAGVEDGQVIRLRGQGGEGRNGGPAGDLLLTVKAAGHPFLRREGRDLEMDLPVKLAEAIGGATVEVPTPSGRVRVKVPAGSSNGQRLRLGGKGVMTASGAGDLYLVLRPVLPKASDDEAMEHARALDARGDEDPRATLTI
jgi:DnaJ-class molecular chaperone